MKPVESSWSRGAWFWGFVFIFLAHALAVFWLAERREYKTSRTRPRAMFYLGGGPEFERRLAEVSVLRDPTLFALPHEHGFSGGAWLNFEPRPPASTNGSAPPEWLTLDTEWLGGALQEYITTNRPSETRLLASLRATRSPEARIADDPILTNSTVQIESGSTVRRLISWPKLPSVPLAELPGRTIVSVTVNGDGQVESASVARESASKWADQRAIELALRLEFEPLPVRNVRARLTAPPTVLSMVFNWHAVTPTNGTVTASTR
jgi:TonB family protein